MKTKIQWCDYTFNPWRGCAKVSPGCANCYAEGWGKRFGVEWGPGKPRQRASTSYLRQPLRWDRLSASRLRAWEAAKQTYSVGDEQFTARGFIKPVRHRVFCGSLMDWLDPEVPIEWLAELLDTIRKTPNLDWLLLTKRPEKWRDRIGWVIGRSCITGCDERSPHGMAGWLANRWLNGFPPPNVWLGTSAEDQRRWDERVPVLLNIPAKVRFVSVEPLLTAIDMWGYWGRKPDWIILGGESGPKARPCNVEWIRSAVRQCKDAGVKAFVKQLGACPVQLPPKSENYSDGSFLKGRFNKKADAMAEWPEDLRVREWPKEVEE